MHIQFVKNLQVKDYFNEAIRVEAKNGILETRQNIFACVKGKNDLPILQFSKPLETNELERKASKIASFLKVPLKGS